jgi:hypothetical protein
MKEIEKMIHPLITQSLSPLVETTSNFPVHLFRSLCFHSPLALLLLLNYTNDMQTHFYKRCKLCISTFVVCSLHQTAIVNNLTSLSANFKP